ncbi:MAG: sterol desaturase family protein [Myxococcota bacterium]
MDMLLEVAMNGSIFVLKTWIRYTIICGGAFALFWLLLARPLQHRRCQDKAPDRSVLWSEFKNSLSGSIFFLIPIISAIPLYHAGHLKVDFNAAPGEPVWMVVSFILFVIGADAWFYWVHRVMHDSRIYAWTHELHHVSENPSPLASYSFSLLEGIGLGLYLPLVLLIFPMNVWVIAAFALFFALLEAYVHLGYEIAPRGFASNPITKWFGTSVFHNMHHENGAFNFGVYFTFWDRVMGTIHPEYETRFKTVTRKPLISIFQKSV